MNVKTTLAVPTNRGLNPQTFQCLLELVARGGYDFEILIAENGYTIAENRNWIATQAVKNGSDYLLMCDDDMTFLPDLLDTLIANDKDICGVAYHPRCETGQIIKYLDETHFIKLQENTDPKYKQTFECWATGTGIILVKTEVFKKTPQPWFEFEYYPNGCCKQGEDWMFCKKAKNFGFKTFADPTIKCGHLGECLF